MFFYYNYKHYTYTKKKQNKTKGVLKFRHATVGFLVTTEKREVTHKYHKLCNLKLDLKEMK